MTADRCWCLPSEFTSSSRRFSCSPVCCGYLKILIGHERQELHRSSVLDNGGVKYTRNLEQLLGWKTLFVQVVDHARTKLPSLIPVRVRVQAILGRMRPTFVLTLRRGALSGGDHFVRMWSGVQAIS